MTLDFGALRGKYLRLMPNGTIDSLLIAESPPNQRSNVPFFFYYDGKDIGDLGGLFEHTMSALYPDMWRAAEESGESLSDVKRTFLRKFSEDGFYLIDETDQILSGLRKSKKREVLNRVRDSGSLLKQIDALARHGYLTNKTKVVLISALGYDVFFDYLKAQSVRSRSGELSLNELMVDKRIPLPYRGNEGDYVRSIRSLKKGQASVIEPSKPRIASKLQAPIPTSPSPSRRIIPLRPPIDRIVVDGSNISCYGMESGIADFTQLLSVYRQLSSKYGFHQVKVIIGPGMRHKEGPKPFEWLEMKFNTEKDRRKTTVFYQAPAGASDDAFIINFAIENDYLILTNDRYLDHKMARPNDRSEIDRRLVKYMVIDENLSITGFPAY